MKQLEINFFDKVWNKITDIHFVAAKALHLLKPVGMIFHNIITLGEILYLWRVDPNTWS